ncbi:MAG: branched-chain amino acid transport system permease protein [Alphaproteobacteria bacterium]|jgi:branched-chain amino acid transport system permease protein
MNHPLPQPRRPSRIFILTLLCVIVAVGLFPLIGEKFHILLATRIFILAIFAMSLNLLIGYTGLISFGHAAFFGAAGYILAIVSPEDGPVAFWWSAPLAIGGVAILAAAIGWMSIRTSGVYFIMITLAFAQMLYFFFNDSPYFGGSDGAFIYFRPSLALGDFNPVNLDNRIHFYYLAALFVLVVWAFLAMLLRSPFGQVIKGVRANEPRMRALGYATQRYKLVSFIIAGGLAGLAGYLNAAQSGYVSPAHLGWQESGSVMMMVILGGMGALHGPILGAFSFVILHDILRDLSQHWLLLMGGFVVAVVLFLPKGLAGLVDLAGITLKRRAARRDDSDDGHD